MIGRLLLAALTLLLLVSGNLANAQDYPARTVRLVVAFPAGGPTDFVARVLVNNEDPESVGKDVVDFRLPKQTLYYNFDHEYPAWAQV